MLLRCTPSLLTHASDSNSPSDSYILCATHTLKKEKNASKYPAQHVAYCRTHTFVDLLLRGPVAVAHVAHVSVQLLARQSSAGADRRPQGQQRMAQGANPGIWDEDKMNCGLVDGIIIDSDTANLRWMDAQPASPTNVMCRQQ